MDGTGIAQAGAGRIAREIAAMIGCALFLALLGPFGMFAEPFARRLVEWLAFALGGYLFFRPVLAAAGALAGATRVPLAIALALACLLAALPTTLLVCATMVGWQMPRIALGTLLALYPKVLVVGGGVTLLLLLARRRAPAPPSPLALPSLESNPVSRPALPPEREPELETPGGTLPPPAPGARFLDRLPPAIGSTLLCVENEDHYLRVHTDRGNALILLRLRDAVAELAGVDGLRVHRGWWVARAAVAEVLRRDRAVALRLVNGLEVPVARSEVPVLRAAGWL